MSDPNRRHRHRHRHRRPEMTEEYETYADPYARPRSYYYDDRPSRGRSAHDDYAYRRSAYDDRLPSRSRGYDDYSPPRRAKTIVARTRSPPSPTGTHTKEFRGGAADDYYGRPPPPQNALVRRRSRSIDVNNHGATAEDYYKAGLMAGAKGQPGNPDGKAMTVHSSKSKHGDDDERSGRRKSRSEDKEARKDKSKGRSKSRGIEIGAALVGAAAGFGGKEAFDRRQGKPNHFKNAPLETAGVSALGAFAGYEAAKAINRAREKRSMSRGPGSEEEKDIHPGHHGAEAALGALGVGAIATKAKHGVSGPNWGEWQTRMKAMNIDDKYTRAARAAMTAAAMEAWKCRNDTAPLTGAKGMKIAQAAFAAGRLDASRKGGHGAKASGGEGHGGSEGGEKHGEGGGGGGGGGLGGLENLASLGIAATTAQKLYKAYRSRSKSRSGKDRKSRSKPDKGSNDSGDDSEDEDRRKPRRKSSTGDFLKKGLGALGLEEVAESFMGKDKKEKEDKKEDKKERRKDNDDSDSDRSHRSHRSQRTPASKSRRRRNSSESGRSDDYKRAPDNRDYSDGYAQPPTDHYPERYSNGPNGYNDTAYAEPDLANPYASYGQSRGFDSGPGDNAALVPAAAAAGAGAGEVAQTRNKSIGSDTSRRSGLRGGGARGHSPNYGGGDSSGDSSASPWDSEVSSSEEEKRIKKARKKEIFAGTLAAAASLQAAHGLWEAKEKREERLKSCEKEDCDPQKIKSMKRKANLRNLGTAAVAAYGLKEAIDAMKGVKKIRDEKRNQAMNYQRHHEKRIQRSKSQAERQKRRSLKKSPYYDENGIPVPGAVAVVPPLNPEYHPSYNEMGAAPIQTGYDPDYDEKYDLKGEPDSHRDEWGYQDRPGKNGPVGPDMEASAGKGFKGGDGDGDKDSDKSRDGGRDRRKSDGHRHKHKHSDKGRARSHGHRRKDSDGRHHRHRSRSRHRAAVSPPKFNEVVYDDYDEPNPYDERLPRPPPVTYTSRSGYRTD